MKQILALLMTTALLFGCFAGCAAEPTPSTEPSTIPSTEPSTSPSTQPSTENTAPQYEVISIEKALELCGSDGNVTTERYYIRGIVESITNPTFGAMVITDGTHSISVYNTAGYADMEDKPYKGDEVLLYCTLQNFNGNKEIKAADLIEFKHIEVDVDESKYTDMNIVDAREAAEGTLIKVDGVVAQITYANGHIPSGVILVDNTSSIYVYDNNLAGRVKVGNKITVLASKTWWILGDETANAQKFGYKGCCQLESVTLLDCASDLAEFDKGWIQTSTVKEMLDTPVSTDITTKIFKVNALVNKVEGTGFTNYYFNDLDGTTGSYTYTQCNGSDFTWLDKFDGKICTVYLTVLNAKSTASGCVYRFLPIAVSDDGFKFDTTNAAEFAVRYHGVGQFLPNYTGNPKLEVVTSVSSELLGFQDAKLSYSSSNETVVAFSTSGGKTVMECLSTGKATVTITGSYGGKTYQQKVEISAEIAQEEVKAPTVSDVIAAQVGEEVTVKGIIGPSLVNKVGFYLIDNSGVIAVLTDEATMATVQIGQEVVLKGIRHINTKGGTNYYGQTCIKDATVVTNNYGTYDYSTDSFDGEISVSDFYNLDVTKDFTTNVYTMKATVVVEDAQYYSNIFLSDGSTKVRLYCSGATQYSWLKAYAGQEVTVEIAPCNWNDKNYYVGCVLAVRNTDGTKVLNQLNFSK